MALNADRHDREVQPLFDVMRLARPWRVADRARQFLDPADVRALAGAHLAVHLIRRDAPRTSLQPGTSNPSCSARLINVLSGFGGTGFGSVM